MTIIQFIERRSMARVTGLQGRFTTLARLLNHTYETVITCCMKTKTEIK